MTDFRDLFYQRYVSAFKNLETPVDDSILPSYLAWCRHHFRPLFSSLAKTASILELGCGPGYMMTFLQSEDFVNVRGIDLSAEQARVARERGLAVEVVNAVTYLENTKETFDAIVALDFVEHFSKAELLSLAPLIYGHLNPGGLLILQTPNGQGLFPNQIIYGDLTHLTIFSPSSLRQLLRLSGFYNIQIRETGPVTKNTVGWLRLILWQVARITATVIRMAETGKRQRIWSENMICCAYKQDKLDNVNTP
jgi:SAM-dependent methyltransferase